MCRVRLCFTSIGRSLPKFYRTQDQHSYDQSNRGTTGHLTRLSIMNIVRDFQRAYKYLYRLTVMEFQKLESTACLQGIKLKTGGIANPHVLRAETIIYTRKLFGGKSYWFHLDSGPCQSSSHSLGVLNLLRKLRFRYPSLLQLYQAFGKKLKNEGGR